MFVIFKIKLSKNKNIVQVGIFRQGKESLFTIGAAEFVASIDNDDIYDHLVTWFGSTQLPTEDSPIYDDIAAIYRELKYGRSDEVAEKKRGFIARSFIGLARPSIIPQALVKHRVSPFADSERVWQLWVQTRPDISRVQHEEKRLQALQASIEQKFLASPEASAYRSKFEALMAFKGITEKHLKRSFFTNLALAFIFIFIGLFQVYMMILMASGNEKSVLSLPILNVFEFLAWPLIILTCVFSFTVGMGRLWYCNLINARKLEFQYPFFTFLKSGRYLPGDFKEFRSDDE